MKKRWETGVTWTRRVMCGALLVVGATGCVETSLYEKAALDLDRARRENGQRDVHIRALQLQIGFLSQQMQNSSKQSAIVVESLERRVHEDAVAKQQLAEQLVKK